LLASKRYRSDKMHIAPAIAAVFVERLRLRVQKLRDLRSVFAMNRASEVGSRLRRAIAVVRCKCDVAFAMV
jgi:hypothetical protein